MPFLSRRLFTQKLLSGLALMPMFDPWKEEYLSETQKGSIDVAPVQIQLIRHATLLVQLHEIKLLIDPMLRPKGRMNPVRQAGDDFRTPITELPLTEADLQILLQETDAVLITHLRRDPWDEAAIQQIPKQKPIFCQPGDAVRIREQGFTVVEPVTDCLSWRGIQISRTCGKHDTGEPGEETRNASGFILEKKELPKLYIAGDTVWCAAVQVALQTHQPAIVVLNAGASRFTSGDSIAMTVADVKQVCLALPHAKVIAVHLDAVNLCHLSRQDLAIAIEQENLQQMVYIPQDGQTILF